MVGLEMVVSDQTTVGNDQIASSVRVSAHCDHSFRSITITRFAAAQIDVIHHRALMA